MIREMTIDKKAKNLLMREPNAWLQNACDNCRHCNHSDYDFLVCKKTIYIDKQPATIITNLPKDRFCPDWTPG